MVGIGYSFFIRRWTFDVRRSSFKTIDSPPRIGLFWFNKEIEELIKVWKISIKAIEKLGKMVEPVKK